MGGPLSPAKSGLVYRGRERRFNTSPRRWELWGMAPLRWRRRPIQRYVVVVRIADDDYVASSVHCPKCVAQKLSAVYTAPLLHKSEQEGPAVNVTDVCIEVAGAHCKITRLNKNMSYILGLPKQLRTRYLPPLRPPLVTRVSLVGWLSGSLSLDRRREPNLAH